jgi:hypothetical protein
MSYELGVMSWELGVGSFVCLNKKNPNLCRFGRHEKTMLIQKDNILLVKGEK